MPSAASQANDAREGGRHERSRIVQRLLGAQLNGAAQTGRFAAAALVRLAVAMWRRPALSGRRRLGKGRTAIAASSPATAAFPAPARSWATTSRSRAAERDVAPPKGSPSNPILDPVR
jgi:hypothetical protein